MILFARNPSAKVPCGVVNLWRFRLDFCKPKQYSRFEVDEYKWNFGGWISIFSVWWTVFFFLRAHYVFYSRFEFFFFQCKGAISHFSGNFGRVLNSGKEECEQKTDFIQIKLLVCPFVLLTKLFCFYFFYLFCNFIIYFCIFLL